MQRRPVKHPERGPGFSRQAKIAEVKDLALGLEENHLSAPLAQLFLPHGLNGDEIIVKSIHPSFPDDPQTKPLFPSDQPRHPPRNTVFLHFVDGVK